MADSHVWVVGATLTDARAFRAQSEELRTANLASPRTLRGLLGTLVEEYFMTPLFEQLIHDGDLTAAACHQTLRRNRSAFHAGKRVSLG